MRRRDLLAGLMASTTASGLWAAEPAKVYRLAACVQSGMEGFSISFYARFFDHLRQLGYVEGKNLVVDRYAANNNEERYVEVARDAVRSKPDVIVVMTKPIILQVTKETSTIPILALVADPVALGLVQNIARPEGNITGVAVDTGIEFQGKYLDILRQAVPSASRIAYLSPREDWEGAWGRAILDAGRQSGVSIIGMPMKDSADDSDYRQAFETMAQQSVEALIVNGFVVNYIHRQLIAELAMKYRLPSICWFSDAVKTQGLLSYAPDYDDIVDHLADQAEQLFKGEKPADIPFYQPTKYKLAINLRTARALSLTIPSSLLVSADEVIE